MNIFSELGTLALATRLKSLSEYLAKDVAAVYSQLDIPFEPRWFTLFWALKKNQVLTITEIARELRQTHSAVVQATTLLEKKGLINSSKDKNDERRRQVSLSQKGILLFEKVEPILQAIEKANDDLLKLHAPDLLQNLSALENALDNKKMLDRIMENIGLLKQDISIHNYTPEYAALFEKHAKESVSDFVAKPYNKNQLRSDSQEEKIFFALHKNEVIGQATLEVTEKGQLWLTRFAVINTSNNSIIEEVLFESIISYAYSNSSKLLQLMINPLKPESINYFIGKGFRVVPLSSKEIIKASTPHIKMSLVLNT